MNSPKKHHLVSECYMSEFATESKRLLQVYDLQWKKRAKPKTPAQVCYEIDAFKIKSQDTLKLENIEDEYIVEKEYFKKVENSYPKTLSKIKNSIGAKVYLSLDEAENFLGLLLSIKRRSNNFRETMTSRDGEQEYLEKKVEEMLPVIQQAANLAGQGNDLKNSIKELIGQTLNNTERRYDRYLMLLGGSNVLDELIDFLLGLKWFILNAPIGIQFITSDNPGFNLDDKYRVSKFGGFGDEFKFIFPLTPLHALLIKKNDIDENILESKALNFINAEVNLVKSINMLTMSTAREKVFSNSYSAIENILG